mgnify:CR=1 FL=1
MDEDKPSEQALHEQTAPSGPAMQAPVHADERTIRQAAEREHGGIGTDEMRARYETGEHPGGLHEKAPVPPEDVAEGRLRASPHAHPYDDEPPDPKLRRPGHRRAMSSKRAGA